MKSRNSKFALMAGLVGLASFVVTACTDSDTAQETQKKVEDGISFAVTDIQNISESSLPKTKAPSVYETTSTPLEGEGAEGLSLLETTVEGVNPVYQPAATRGTITTNDNFAGLNKPFAIFATKEGSTAANYLYNEKVNADGTMVNPVKWKKSESSKLKFFAVHPATNGDNSMVTTTSGTNPVVNYTPATDVKKQFDLLVANTNSFNYDDYVSQKIPIAFSHATTAVLFKVGNDLSYNQQVKKIEIRNVIGNGTYDIATKAWTVGTTKKNFALELSTPFSTAVNPGAIMNGGDGTFFMVPQDIPADADVKITFVSGKSVVAKIGGNGKKWVAGTTRTYAISNPKDLEDRNAVLTVSSDKSTYNYNETDVPFKVTSYSELTGSGRPAKAEPWAITKYEFSADGTTWTEGKPSMVAAMSSESGNGGTSAEARTMTFTNEYHDYKAEREAALKAATEENGKDLSMVNGSKSTANCYIVSAGGTYKFPMVYGNAYKNGVDNTEAYKPTGASSNYFVTPFYHGTDEVQYSWGKDNGEITKAEIEHADDAKVLWNSEPNLVKDAKISADGKFVEFSVDRSKIKEASAIIAVTRGTTYKNVLWSWHIWITSKDVVDTDNGYFMREPLGFRHTKWQGTTYEKDRKVRLTVTQTRTGKTATVEFTQKASPMVREGEAMYYQQGRKDPLINATGFSHQPPVNNSGLVLLHSVNFPMRMGAARRYNETGVSKGNWDWCWNPDENGTYFNLWDANNRQGHGYAGAFVKTVYDPSPVGFRVPRLAEFEKINNGNNGKAAFTPLTGFLSYVDFSVHNKGANGYYWSSEKKEGPGNMGTDQEYYGYYGLFALARGSQKDLVLKRDFTTTKNFPMFQNMAWGANVISIKE
ncbi:fimbrillin family protein [Prevotella melaninogenica]|uniref:fimbrillin family protein n=1 Tax=Prevotella melaninogenica TaxID=28132 RepID=UPI00241C65BF|nr:fimbrillin family protein [Prevotella melaninogenica]